nr:uncharacterized protein [Tanacetum cinerariifolium]
VLNGLIDPLYNVYCKTMTAKELWESLKQKYKTEDAGTKKFVVPHFLDYKMVDSKNVISQVQDLHVLIHEIHAKGMTLSETFQVAAIIENFSRSAGSSSRSNPKGKGKDKRKNDKKSKGKSEYLASKAGIVKQKVVDNGQKLYMGNSATADIKGEGDVILKMTSEKELKLANVLYVLEI